jgi:hypothetical protein
MANAGLTSLQESGQVYWGIGTHAYNSAVQQQLDAYWHTLVYGEFVLSPQVKLAQLLAENLPGLGCCLFHKLRHGSH